jgi:hypothetical protein
MIESFTGGGNRTVYVCFACCGDGKKYLFGGRRDHIDRIVAGGRYPFTVDEKTVWVSDKVNAWEDRQRQAPYKLAHWLLRARQSYCLASGGRPPPASSCLPTAGPRCLAVQMSDRLTLAH